jgi:hypothetical protein
MNASSSTKAVPFEVEVEFFNRSSTSEAILTQMVNEFQSIF